LAYPPDNAQVDNQVLAKADRAAEEEPLMERARYRPPNSIEGVRSSWGRQLWQTAISFWRIQVQHTFQRNGCAKDDVPK
jgi:hypothetical protein